MTIGETMERARDGAMHRISEAKMDRTARENDELRTENKLLRDELDESRSERKKFLDLLDKGQLTTPPGSKRRGYKLMRLVAIGGAVYAVGVKTGAIERVKGWLQGKASELDTQLKDTTAAVTHRVGDAIEHAGRDAERLGESIERKAGDRSA